ncbi:MAG: lipoate--protein ligase family protein [Planctomycetes bacterium]|nr:lipoate--protein ligase family protein [Planctomycetota bacterium]
MIEPACCRVLIDPQPQSGVWNMAVDETLLESAIEQGTACVRVYSWSAPTLSLGYFQKTDDLPVDSPLRKIAAVRRLSGGGALVHHRELTYSIALPPGHPLAAEPTQLTRRVHAQVLNFLRCRNVSCAMRGETLPAKSPPDEPFLCFDRADPHDVISRGAKILGSAQRRRRGAVLQHGGLLLKASSWTPHLQGVSDLFPGFAANNSGRRLAEDFGASLAAALFADPVPDKLSVDETVRVRELETTRYGSADWRIRSRTLVR